MARAEEIHSQHHVEMSCLLVSKNQTPEFVRFVAAVSITSVEADRPIFRRQMDVVWVVELNR